MSLCCSASCATHLEKAAASIETGAASGPCRQQPAKFKTRIGAAPSGVLYRPKSDAEVCLIHEESMAIYCWSGIQFPSSTPQLSQLVQKPMGQKTVSKTAYILVKGKMNKNWYLRLFFLTHSQLVKKGAAFSAARAFARPGAIKELCQVSPVHSLMQKMKRVMLLSECSNGTSTINQHQKRWKTCFWRTRKPFAMNTFVFLPVFKRAPAISTCWATRETAAFSPAASLDLPLKGPLSETKNKRSP